MEEAKTFHINDWRVKDFENFNTQSNSKKKN